ncbi:hypothetical protein K402DRAFT_407886 [Aulographum hederae CBS 113979]|uniref:Zn(2)-C6 fungal-type domain-containing protein n=1 Tax=Aulographum hederae CBS 113979 TaxID=1176131 RepID=A0A6G1GME7_9PEZI|nr:hypothetical protein K402DRAFT_407886 [Aulographum hederae CBS 113979]
MENPQQYPSPEDANMNSNGPFYGNANNSNGAPPVGSPSNQLRQEHDFPPLPTAAQLADELENAARPGYSQQQRFPPNTSMPPQNQYYATVPQPMPGPGPNNNFSEDHEDADDDQSGKKKKSKASRACDTCRRKKIKCDAPDEVSACTACIKTAKPCTFSREQQKRGPSKGYIYSSLASSHHPNTQLRYIQNLQTHSSNMSQHMDYVTNRLHFLEDLVLQLSHELWSTRRERFAGLEQMVHHRIAAPIIPPTAPEVSRPHSAASSDPAMQLHDHPHQVHHEQDQQHHPSMASGPGPSATVGAMEMRQGHAPLLSGLHEWNQQQDQAAAAAAAAQGGAAQVPNMTSAVAATGKPTTSAASGESGESGGGNGNGPPSKKRKLSGGEAQASE